jgi:hypothetical protein
MVSMGEEPVLTSEPLPSRYDAADLQAQRRARAEARLESGLAFDKLASELTAAVGAAARD